MGRIFLVIYLENINHTKNKKCHNLSENISTCDDSIWKIYRIFVRIFLVIYLENVNYTKNKKYHNLSENISTCDGSIWKIYRIFVRIFLVYIWKHKLQKKHKIS